MAETNITNNVKEYEIVCGLYNIWMRPSILHILEDIKLSPGISEDLYRLANEVSFEYDRDYLNKRLRDFNPHITGSMLKEVNNCIEGYIHLKPDELGRHDNLYAQNLGRISEKGKEIFITQLAKLYSENAIPASTFIGRISQYQQASVTSTPTKIIKVGDLDFKKVFREDFGTPEDMLPSFCDALKASNGVFNSEKGFSMGYFRNQVAMVVAPPGRGKSLFCMNEANEMCHKGFKVFYLALGDLVASDFFIRLNSISRKVPLNDSTNQALNYKNQEGDIKLPDYISDNLHICVVPPQHLSPMEIKNLCHSNPAAKESDVFIIDYDDNVRADAETLYEKGEMIYNEAKYIAGYIGKKKLVIIGSQVKIDQYNKNILGLESAATSSKKQQISDVVITISSKNSGLAGSAEKVGIFNVVKNRRGLNGVLSYFEQNHFGRFEMIDKDKYDASANAGGTYGNN